VRVTRRQVFAAALFGLIAGMGWFAYAPALGGAFLLDDLSNLGGLRSVDDAISALTFVFSGSAGPLGRPLALATFLPQAEAWGNDASPFLTVNILIHLINACLLALVLHRLAVISRVYERNALGVATAGAALWLFMPLLASASLMVVQRMTTLSALFVLLGFAAYLLARQSVDKAPGRALTGMSISLVAGTVLAVLSKENGALLPTLVLVAEATVLPRPSSVSLSRWRAWTALFLWLPTVLIVIYLLLRLPYSAELVLRRDFTGWQRLLTESRILWEYLFNAFIPQPGKFSPFHDGYGVARTILDPLTFLAFSGWAAALTLAILWRRRFPLMSFAVLWFVAGHLLESTFIPLELYFEHRNYLPVIGPVFALCALAFQVPEEKRKLAYAGLGAYVLVNALVLFSQASLWGDPSTAAHYWQARFPESMRAATTAATWQLALEGPRSTSATLHRLVEQHPESGYLKIQELNLYCIIAPQEDHRATVAELETLLKKVDFSYTAGTMLSQLLTTAIAADCNDVDVDTVRNLARSLLSNPRYVGDGGYNHLHHQLMARMSRHEGNFEDAIAHLEKAAQFKRSSELNMMVVTTLADAKDFDGARRYIDEARRNAPIRPVKRYLWQHELDALGNYVVELERHAAKPEASLP
jgi:hypothetical protein